MNKLTTTNETLCSRPTPEVIARAMSLLQSIVEHKRANMRGIWEKTLYPISDGCDIRMDKPDVRSDEVQLLIVAELVSFIPTCQNKDIPDSVLRLLNDDEDRAEEILRRYVNSLQETS